MTTRAAVLLSLALAACGGSGDATDGGRDAGPRADAGGGTDAGSGTDAAGGTDAGSGTDAATRLLAAEHPGDVGIASDPDVVWAEDFEEANVAAFQARYDQVQNAAGETFDPAVPAASHGAHALRLVSSGTGANATDFYKDLGPGYDELYVRYYVKYQAGVMWHHSGVWFGGYDPHMTYPAPMAGLRPNGDDRFSISIEPIAPGPNARLDYYNYWMTMHSWMDVPMGPTAYYGNSLVHDSTLRATDDTWLCIEVHAKVNPDPASAAGAELGVWRDDTSVQQFSDAAPLGYWIKDKFCPDAADGTECTMYRPAMPTLVPLDLRFRSVATLKLNAFWPQNYITSGGDGSMWLDDMVVATRRVGCIR